MWTMITALTFVMPVMSLTIDAPNARCKNKQCIIENTLPGCHHFSLE
jgi:hypothetical protein